MTKEQEIELFSKLKETGFFDELQQNEKSVEFANSIKNLKLLPSTDSRVQINNSPLGPGPKTKSQGPGLKNEGCHRTLCKE